MVRPLESRGRSVHRVRSPIYEKRIVRRNGLYVWEDDRKLPQSDACALCRCRMFDDTLFYN